MRDKYIQTAESVTEGHPDKLCDTIADTVLDACLEHDPNAHVACEVLATAGKILVAGEITAKALPDIPAIVARTVHETGYHADYEIEVITHDQSPNIAGAVDRRGIFSDQRGAGDQGIMYGYACSETDELLPTPVILAHRLTRLLTHARKTGTIRGLGPDGKAQVSVEYVLGLPRRVNNVVVSCQHSADKDVSKLRQEIMKFVIIPAFQEISMDEDTEILVNPSGRFVEGGPAADTGLTGRKLMVDTYGGLAAHGGGAFSGKDPTKVDRSAAYMARAIARNVVGAWLAEECQVSISYAIGKAEPTAVEIDTFGTARVDEDVIRLAVLDVFDLRPAAIMSLLHLRAPIYADTAAYGHFNGYKFSWENLDKTEELRKAVEKYAD